MKIDTITKEQLQAYFYEQGMSTYQVAKEFNCRPSTVERRLQRHHIDLDPNIWGINTSQAVRLLLLQGAKLTRRQQSIVVGSILGDGCLSTGNGKHACLICMQCIARRGYVEWLQEELRPFTSSPISTPTTNIKASNKMRHSFLSKSYKHARFHTVQCSEFTRFYNLFYPEGKKIVPSCIGIYLDELALAVWFMDDGVAYKHYSVLNTQGFTRPECELLCEVLLERLGIDSHVLPPEESSEKYKPFLYIGRKDHYQLHEVNDPLMHKDFEKKKLKPGTT